jgi:hypothetical protein
VVIYIDDIFIYSDSLEELAEHLRKVFQRLRENKLYAKLEKCEFGVTKVDFLGHRITQESLKMDDHKVKAIVDWKPPKSMPALSTTRIFIFCNLFYATKKSHMQLFWNCMRHFLIALDKLLKIKILVVKILFRIGLLLLQVH